MSVPICKITALDHPEEIPENRAVEISIVYENSGDLGPTFYRVRKPGTWDFNMMGDNKNHVPGEPSGGYVYATAPEGHMILQVEVGYGTWLNPIKITDAAMIVILDPACPAPDVDDVKVIVDIVHPPEFWPAVQRFWIEPGAVIAAAWINDNRAIEPGRGENAWRMKFQRGLDGGPVQWEWTVDKVPWTDRDAVFEVGPGETQILEMKATIPENYESKMLSFMVYPINRELVYPTGE